jgi:two-component system cell cycle sensor histidine kinase/response regulator CckA
MRPLKVLIVEDAEDDAALLLLHLARAGYDVRHERVQTAETMKNALAAEEWEIIISDFQMPNFTGLEALQVLLDSELDIPFILISGTIGEETAVQAMLAGVSDYMMKDKLARLVPAIERELQEARNRYARRLAEEALRVNEDHYRDLVENSFDLISTYDLKGRVLSVNQMAVKVLGYSKDALLGRDIREILLPEYRHEFDDYIDKIQQTGVVQGIMSVRTSSGEKRVWEFTNTLRTEGVSVPIVRGVARDVTEQRHAESALRESEERYRLLFESNPFPMWVYDLETLRFLAVNEAAADNYGYSREEFLSMTIIDIRPPEDIPAVLRSALNINGGVHKAGVWKHQKKDGSVIDVEIISHQITFAGRKAKLVLPNDITERNRAEESLRKAEEKYRSIFENAVEGIFQSTSDGRFISANPAMIRILGYESLEELLEHRIDIETQYYVDSSARLEIERMLAESEVVVGFECEIYRKDMSKIWTIENIRAIRNESGELLWYEGSIEDITEGKRTEEALRASEEQLRQSQKLESIGQLAGGIAHDFNNLLTAIIGYSELSLRRLQAEDPLQLNIKEIKRAGEQAAGLTRQLLAFSRKQVLQPKILNINSVVSDFEKMLQRLIGEDIELRTMLEPEIGNVKADPGQLEQVIMNLAINARDAMPKGGKLTIETNNIFLDESCAAQHADVIPGFYVKLTVSDIGTGMDDETQKRIFEPFFTTKGLGKGTGLGLSTVYGIIKQSGGNIWVYSELGYGTTFKVYLPCVNEDAQEYKRSYEPEEDIQGTETILLAEDEEVVRKLARKVLESYGYQILEAASGGSALLICERHQEPIQLLITDVIMPEMSGRELAERLSSLRPEMKVLYMSGYTDNAIIHHGVLDEGTDFIQKPFVPNALAQKVREVLDEQ